MSTDPSLELDELRARIAALEAELTKRDQQIVTLADQADEFDMLHRKAIAKTEEVRADLAAIDRELYGDQTLNYNPNRVLTIQAIKKLSTSEAELEARGQLEVACARIAALEAERDRLREIISECLDCSKTLAAREEAP